MTTIVDSPILILDSKILQCLSLAFDHDATYPELEGNQSVCIYHIDNSDSTIGVNLSQFGIHNGELILICKWIDEQLFTATIVSIDSEDSVNLNLTIQNAQVDFQNYIINRLKGMGTQIATIHPP